MNETTLFQRGECWGAFAEQAAAHSEAAANAVLAMLAENQSPGLDAFKPYREKLNTDGPQSRNDG